MTFCIIDEDIKGGRERGVGRGRGRGKHAFPKSVAVFVMPLATKIN